MTEKDLLIQEQRKKISALEKENAELKKELKENPDGWIHGEELPVEKMLQYRGRTVMESDPVWITIEDPKTYKRTTDLDKTINGKWDYYRDCEVLAWQPRKPDPYQGGKKNE